ncbi:hypothetical protein GCM10010435_21900 [Winogradskya consettensis]|uniref:Uncharacterized protein n=1 Tax=Winogradskya consettensis TaxID=113560 RepID=A0A919VKI7_9ACTN|nr:hypothetical protein Aco04nite_02810 [Actinoplanes consettensis]
MESCWKGSNLGPVTPDRAQGATLYALATALLVAGGTWFFAAAPALGEDPALAVGRRTVERLVPDTPDQAQAETMVLGAGSSEERSAAVGNGVYTVTMACVGSGQIRVRVSITTADSGKAVPCAPTPTPVELNVSVAAMLFLSITSESQGEAVFRWRATPAASY